ncbi:MAG: PAC2 family protein [Nitrososphaerota archaeon]|nr:PAC2 family protein [Aigarchaeota archaeon]MDW8077170.1 PAC2 family protein [Nitrososphaerota archaeon]
MEEIIRFYEQPSLKEPCLVAGFYGWSDGGRVSSMSLIYLLTKLPSKLFAEMNPEPFYDFTVRRPYVSYKSGIMTSYTMPKNEFWYVKEAGGRSLVLLLGEEPNLNWIKYVDTIIQVIKKFGVKRVYTIGGLLDRVPHTVEPIISFFINNENLRKDVLMFGGEFTNYEGPSSIHSLILYACMKEDIEAMSIWGHSPIYLPFPDIQTTYYIVRKLLEHLKIKLDLSDLEAENRDFKTRLDIEMQSQPELKRLVLELEDEYYKTRRRLGYMS